MYPLNHWKRSSTHLRSIPCNFADTEILEGSADKGATLEAIINLLQTRNTTEVKMTYRILKDIIETFNGSGNTKNST